MSTIRVVPLPLRWLRAHGLRGLRPWHFTAVATDGGDSFRREFQKEVSRGSQPERDFLPFARRAGNDDVAGFVVENGAVTEKVIVAHLTWIGGHRQRGYPMTWRYADLWEWMKSAIDDTPAEC